MDFVRFGHDRGQRVTGWKRAAHTNSVVLSVITLILLVSLIVSARQSHGVTKALLFFPGTCDGGTAAQLNVALHLLLNAVSTAIFASSNFFMQVLNSPSRSELDKVHAKGSWMGIGVPSVRNAFQVSRFKTYCWILLLLSSIPLHLLFNSLIFQTDQRDSEYQMAIASEGFINDTPFYPPGASLIPLGWFDGTYGTEPVDSSYSRTQSIDMTRYSDRTSPDHRNVSAMASQGSQWDNMTAQDCYNYYYACNGLKEHRNVIVVVNKKDGWIRDEVWHLMANQTELWDPIVPGNETNSLWWAGPCQMTASYELRTGVTCQDTCSGSWGESSGRTGPADKKTDSDPWMIAFFDGTTLNEVNNTMYRVSQSWANDPPNNFTNGLTPGASNLTVSYCLTEHVEQTCHVGISNVLLLAVTICVLAKTVTAVVVTVVLTRREQAPLVTLGDAVVSFIERPDHTTVGMCTVGQRDIRGHPLSYNATQAHGPSEWVGARAVPIPALFSSPSYKATQMHGPRQWVARVHRRARAVPVSVWFSSYALFAVGIGVISFFLNSAMSGLGHLSGEVLESDSNPFINVIQWNFSSAVLTANSPQLLLSFCYLAYNNLFTRLQMAKEWASYSQGYYPLRVTDPKGEQFSTYRLQLPYKYSIPLILCSILLHWILSNTIYVFVSAGGYFNNSGFTSSEHDASLPNDTIVVVGYSAWALLLMLVVALTLVTVPIALSFKRLPTGSVNVGSNSIAISAACHVSAVSNAARRGVSYSNESIKSNRRSWRWLPSRLEARPPPYSPLGDTQNVKRNSTQLADWDSQNLLTPHNRPVSENFEMRDFSRHTSQASLLSGRQTPIMTKEDVYEQIARSRVRWGVVQMPPEFYTEFENDNQPYGHLGFGVEEDNVSPPIEKEKYA